MTARYFGRWQFSPMPLYRRSAVSLACDACRRRRWSKCWRTFITGLIQVCSICCTAVVVSWLYTVNLYYLIISMISLTHHFMTSRKPLCLDLQPGDIKSRWRHNWKSAQVVSSHLVCDLTIQQLGFDLPRNSGLCWTVFARNIDTAMPAEGNGNLQTLICVLVARLRRCPTLSNPVLRQNWMAAYLGYTLRMKTLFPGWPVMVHDTRTRRPNYFITADNVLSLVTCAAMFVIFL